MAETKQSNRPLSPHLTIYRPQLTSMSSIFVRITAIAIFALAIFPAWWLLAAATSESAFAFIDGLMRSWLGDLVLFGATFAIFYHMLGRLRHAIWDLGYFVEVRESENMAIIMIIASVAMAFLVAIIF
ncbi:succinate dehydrogenase, cytochrome b556 subunit [Planktotalea sp.]|uniref:succinate dehydrogenase, cytochrome b556 subunit n=1 Tax=Planktotalea sp. TaxID=2029877 RepID=UPI003297448E